MARLTHEQLQDVMNKYKVNELWSWSKINCFLTSPYEYFLKYVLHKQGDCDNCAYAPIGGMVHSIIEKLYGGTIAYTDMSKEFESDWCVAIDIADLKFDRSDDNKNESIKRKYRCDLEHFFKNHTKIDTKVDIERFLSVKIGDYVLQGYADAIIKDSDGCFNIIDWKTSTKYTGKSLEEHSGQLCVYAMALMQLGVPLAKIRICFNFLKYVTVKYTQKNGSTKTRDIERCKIAESLQGSIRTWLREYGYDPDEYIDTLLDTNSLDFLPDEIKAMYTISDCYTYVPLTQELIDKWQKTITTTIDDIKFRERGYQETKSDKCFWDKEESVKNQSYYFAVLCSYSPRLHLPYKSYLEKLEKAKSGVDLLGGGCDELTESVTDTSDMSWLDEIFAEL